MQPSGFPFGKEVRPYRQGEVVTPFQQPGHSFDQPIGRLVYRSHRWRVVFFLGVGVSLILSLVLTAYLNAIPYKILVNQITNKGFLQAPPELLSPDYTVNQDVLAGFIKAMLVSEKSGESYASFVDESALKVLKHDLVSISLTGLKEAHFSHFTIKGRNFNGKLVDRNNAAILVVSGQFAHEPLETEEEVKLNPLGIYIQSLAIQRL